MRHADCTCADLRCTSPGAAARDDARRGRRARAWPWRASASTATVPGARRATPRSRSSTPVPDRPASRRRRGRPPGAGRVHRPRDRRCAADTTVLAAPVDPEVLADAVRATAPGPASSAPAATSSSTRALRRPADLAGAYAAPAAEATGGRASPTPGWPPSRRSLPGCHPFLAGPDQCLVHNGSFANHATIRRELERTGVRFDSDNDSEVGACCRRRRLAAGEDLYAPGRSPNASTASTPCW